MDFSGVHLWVWNLPNADKGDPAAIVSRLKANGAAGVIVKVADAGHGFNDWNAVAALRDALRAAGLGFSVWAYNYAAAPAAEAAIAVQALQAFSPDALVFDVEQEFEDVARPDLAALTLVQAVRAALPSAPLAYSPLPAIRYHLRLPYRQLSDAGLPMLPQLYWTGLGWSVDQTCSVFYQDAAQYQLTGRPIYPAYEDAPGVRPSDADLAHFCDLVKQQGATGISVWSYEHLDASGWSRVAQAAQAFQAAPQPAPDPVPVPGPRIATDNDREYLHKLIDAEPPGAQFAELISYATQFLP